ncbi:hypothetical protein BGZ51_005143 [Haplosporangium sp. Z 767]|nr:hypothetical protein BGZ51_005143 [Haplosporangium sp. Z 767]KAF9182123.1 hypothetical protein BGZ50_005113 [Haplosporangium sp. Z 11]
MKVTSKHIIVLLFSAMATMTDATVPSLRREDAVGSSTTVFAIRTPPITSSVAGESATTTQFVRRQDATQRGRRMSNINANVGNETRNWGSYSPYAHASVQASRISGINTTYDI